MNSNWQPYTPTESLPWNLQRVKHLHRRAAFGATWTELQRDLRDGPEASITRLLEGKSRVQGQRDDFDSIAKIIGESAARSEDENRLKAWWLFRMLFTPDPLREKLALMWHNHFATSNLKVQDLGIMLRQNELFRQFASDRFGKLLHEMLRDPALLVWLDANSNRVGHPNENLARELMELFTLGIGNYSEQDVKEAARALTGWSIKAGEVTFRHEHHDAEPKTILEHTDRFDAESLAELLLNQEATSRRLAWRLCDLLMGEHVVNQDAIDELASGLRTRQLDIVWAVETILRSEFFFTEKNIGSRVSSPVEYIVGTVRSLEMIDKPPSTLILAEWCIRLGQDLFRPPNVGGWKGGRSWLNSRTLIGRANFAATLVAGELHSPVQLPDLKQLLAMHSKPTDGPQCSAFEFFAMLLLSESVANGNLGRRDDPESVVIELLSSPQACLM